MTDSPIAYEPADFKPFTFKADDRTHLERELTARAIPAERHAGFIAAMEQAIALYKSGNISDLSSASQGQTRDTLQRFSTTLEQMEVELKALDTVQGRVTLAAVGIDLEVLRDQFDDFVKLTRGLDKAIGLPVSDGSGDHTKFFLLKDVALAFPEHLQIDSSSTKGGLYEAVLEIVMKAATGFEYKAPNALAVEGRKLLKK